MLLSGTIQYEAVQRLGEYIDLKELLQAQRVKSQKLCEALGAAESTAQTGALSDLSEQASTLQEKFFLGEVSLDEVSAAKRRVEQAKAASRQDDERRTTLQESLRETDECIQRTQAQIGELHIRLKALLPQAFSVHFDHQRLWKIQREGELQWRKFVFMQLYGKVYDPRDGVAEVGFFCALQAFFTDTPFSVRIVKGFRYAEPQEGGPARILIFNRSEEPVAVPRDLCFEHAFTEICSGRAVFIREHAAGVN